MEKTVEKIRVEALALSISERASLAHDLILSLDEPSDLELSPDQEKETQRRMEMLREGEAEGPSAEAIFADIRAKMDR